MAAMEIFTAAPIIPTASLPWSHDVAYNKAQRQATVGNASWFTLHWPGDLIRYGHGVVSGSFTLRDDDSIRRPFDAQLIVVNYFYHEAVKKSAEM